MLVLKYYLLLKYCYDKHNIKQEFKIHLQCCAWAVGYSEKVKQIPKEGPGKQDVTRTFKKYPTVLKELSSVLSMDFLCCCFWVFYIDLAVEGWRIIRCWQAEEEFQYVHCMTDGKYFSCWKWEASLEGQCLCLGDSVVLKIWVGFGRHSPSFSHGFLCHYSSFCFFVIREIGIKCFEVY